MYMSFIPTHLFVVKLVKCAKTSCILLKMAYSSLVMFHVAWDFLVVKMGSMYFLFLEMYSKGPCHYHKI
jgi:hypothetical protein